MTDTATGGVTAAVEEAETEAEAFPRGFGEKPAPPPKAMEKLSGWRRLRSMRTAIQLLLIVAAISIVGSIVPQRNAAPAKVAEFRAENPFWGEVFERLGLFQVFTSWWFLTLVGLLLVVLVLCLLPRSKAFVDQARQLDAPPEPGRFPSLERMREAEVGSDPDAVLESARAVLKKHRFRCSPVNEERQFVAEKGLAREGGSLLFHWAFFLVVLAAALTITTKFEGTAVIVEQSKWVEGGRVNFDEYSAGALARWVNPHTGLEIFVDDFEVTYRDDGTPSDFVTRAAVIEDGREVSREEIRVNKPLSRRGVKLYQQGYGWAAVARVKSRDRVLFDGAVLLVNRGDNGSTYGSVKLPSADGDQAGLELKLFPDFRLVPFRATNPDDPRAREPGALDIISVADNGERPLVVITEYRGDLRLDRPQSVYDLDKSRLTEVGQRFATFPDSANENLGTIAEMSGGLSVELLELRRFTVLTVKRDLVGIPVAAVAGAVVFVSLYPALYAHRRRLWVQVDRVDESKAVLRCGGVGYQRRDLFAGEFEKIWGELVQGLPDRGGQAVSKAKTPQTRTRR